MTLIPKSSKSNDITNYRPITIQNTVIRLISSLFNHRIQNYIAEISQFNQMGFIKGRDISAAASKFKIIYDMLQTPEYENYFILNVDYSKAFDTVNKTYLSNVVQAVGLGSPAENFILNILNNNTTQVAINNYRSASFGIHRGTPGNPLSPILFNLSLMPFLQIMDYCIEGVYPIPGEPDTRITNISYADDLVIIAKRVLKEKYYMVLISLQTFQV